MTENMTDHTHTDDWSTVLTRMHTPPLTYHAEEAKCPLHYMKNLHDIVKTHTTQCCIKLHNVYHYNNNNYIVLYYIIIILYYYLVIIIIHTALALCSYCRDTGHKATERCASGHSMVIQVAQYNLHIPVCRYCDHHIHMHPIGACPVS